MIPRARFTRDAPHPLPRSAPPRRGRLASPGRDVPISWSACYRGRGRLLKRTGGRARGAAQCRTVPRHAKYCRTEHAGSPRDSQSINPPSPLLGPPPRGAHSSRPASPPPPARCGGIQMPRPPYFASTRMACRSLSPTPPRIRPSSTGSIAASLTTSIETRFRCPRRRYSARPFRAGLHDVSACL